MGSLDDVPEIEIFLDVIWIKCTLDVLMNESKSDSVGGVGGRFKKEEIYVCIQMTLFVVQRELSKHCKAIILKFKKKKKKRLWFHLHSFYFGAPPIFHDFLQCKN